MMSSRWVISNSVKQHRGPLLCLLATLAAGNGVAYSQQAPQPALSDSIAEVIVTASKMAENNQVVPIAVTALTADALAAKGINNVADLGRNVPNVSFDAGVPFGGSSSVLAAYIRGIGQDDFAFNLDPGVGIYIDGVYLARSVGANASMLDVDRVEVLKGPQGTLFGRNSIGGAVSIITHDPSDTFNYKADVTGGSFGRLDVQGRVDIPLSDIARTSLAFSEVHNDGYQRRIPYPGAVAGSSGIPDCDALAAGTKCVVTYDPLNGTPQAGYESGTRQGGENQWTLRGKIAFLPSDTFRAVVSTDYTNVNQQAVANTVLNINPNTPGALGGIYNACLLGITAPFNQVCTSPRLGLSPVPVASNPLPALAGVNVDGNPNDNRLPLDGRYIIPGSVRVGGTNEYVNPDLSYATGNDFDWMKNYGIGITLDWDLSHDMHLKSITAYRGLDWQTGMDLDGSPLAALELSFDMHQQQFSQEFQLTGKLFDDRLDYVGGLYYFEEYGHLHDFVTFADSLVEIDGPNALRTASEAGYVHLHYKLTNRLSLTAGGRYTYEHKTFAGYQTEDDGLVYKITGCNPPGAPANLYLGPGVPAGVTCQQALGFPSATDPYQSYPPGTHTQNFSNFSPTLGLDERITDELMVYASWSQGYKTGGWTTRLTNPEPTYNSTLQFGPEKNIATEVGLKSEWLDRRLRVNVAAFHNSYTNIQLESEVGLSPTYVNAGNAVMKGGELEIDAVAGHGFSLAGSVGYIDAYYTYVNPLVVSNGVQITTAFELPKTPKVKVNLSPQYLINLPNQAALQLGVNWTHTTHLFNDLENSATLERLATDIVDASITYKSARDNWELSLGGTNLTDDRYIVTGFRNNGVDITSGTFNAPRAIFATLRIKS